MAPYRTETTVHPDKSVTVRDLPFAEGQAVDVIVLPHTVSSPTERPLLGLPITYIDPAEPVALEDWEAGA